MIYRVSVVIIDIFRFKLIFERYIEVNLEIVCIENNVKKYLFWLKVR